MAQRISTNQKRDALINWAMSYPALTEEARVMIRENCIDVDSCNSTIGLLDELILKIEYDANNAIDTWQNRRERLQVAIDCMYATTLLRDRLKALEEAGRCSACLGAKKGYQDYDERDRMFFTLRETSKPIPCPYCTDYRMEH